MADRRADVADAASLESALRLSEARYQSLSRAAGTDVWWTDAAGFLLADLPAWRHYTGQTEDDLLGWGWLDAVRSDQRADVEVAWEAAVAASEPLECEFPVHVTHASRERVFRLRAHPVVHQGEVVEWVGTLEDVTDSRRVDKLRLEAGTAETLRRIGTSLVSDLDLERIVQAVTDAATELIDAQFGSFFYNVVDGAGESYMLYTLSGVPREAFANFPMPRNTAVFDPTFRGEDVIRLDDVTQDPRYGLSPPHYGMPDGHLPVRSYLAVPVISRSGQVLGGLFFGHARPGVFTAQHERLVVGIAAQASIAIDNGRLYQTAQREREAAERLAERLDQLQVVGGRLAGAKDVDEVADVVVTRVPEALGCNRAALYLVEDGAPSLAQSLRLVRSSGFGTRPEDRWSRFDEAADLPAAEALRTHRLVVIEDEEDWARRYPARSDVKQESAAMAVIPLALGDQTFGVAAFGWDDPRTFEDDDRHFLESLAGQCSQALERVRLYELERETARTLQRSLLPPQAPDIPGLQVAALHRAGDRTVDVGGDFYDVFRLGRNRWGLAMGDVCGRGARAASRTALVRYSLRAIASHIDRPVDVLHRLNAAVLAETEADDRFCATVFGHIEIDHCGAWITLACAGHPRPVVVRRAGWIDQRGQPGSLIGIFEELDVSEDRVGLGPGDALVFFTDGISEARNAAGEEFGDEALPETLLAGTDLDAEALVDRIREAALDFSGGTVDDDLAVLTVRVPLEAEEAPEEWLRAALGGDAAAEASTPGYPVPHGGRRDRPDPPREARIRLAPEPVSARSARRFLAGVLASWRMPELANGDAALLLSELATNAILHARSSFTVIARYDGSFLRVEVGDGSRAEPRLRREENFGAPGGRGLVLLEHLASRWGILPTARGKRVWFELPVR